MKIVKVTYTTRPDFVVRNCENIQKVMEELQRLNYSGIFYTACLARGWKDFHPYGILWVGCGPKGVDRIAGFR